MAVIESGQKLDVVREEHAISKYVARHVADPDHGKIGGLGIDPHFAEVPFDRFPGSAGGDPHFLVVVTDGTARGECIVQPEAVLLGDAVRDVRESRGPFVCGDHQVRIIAVVANGVFRVNNFARDQVVG
jgi:hypothetical protein